MTKKGEAVVRRFQSQRFALSKRVAARLAELSFDQRSDLMVSAGILTKNSKLAAIYRPRRSGAKARGFRAVSRS